ncbi:MAG: hypothetical protein H6Q89_3382 [Myxococcaceae bacterium]|nr:hypothetical protein [Myxococcaceae bacterium]
MVRRLLSGCGMRARTILAAAVVVAMGCGPFLSFPEPTACSQAAFGENFDALSFGEALERHDDYLVASSDDAGVTWQASARHAGGRLYLRLYPPLTDGALPRPVVSSAGCALTERVRYRDDADGKTYLGSLTMVVLDGGQLDSTGLELALSAIQFIHPDGGTTQLPARQLTLRR